MKLYHIILIVCFILVPLQAPIYSNNNFDLDKAYTRMRKELEQERVEKIRNLKNSFLLSLYEKDEYYQRIPEEYRSTCIAIHQEYDFPFSLIYGLVQAESEWYPRAMNYSNNDGSFDIGLCQLNSKNLKFFDYMFGKHNVWNPIDNLHVGFAYLNYLHRRFGNYHDAIAAYNCGPKRVLTNTIPTRTIQYTTRILQVFRSSF